MSDAAPRRPRTRSLRSSFTALVIAGVVLSTMVCGTLVLFTTSLHRSTRSAAMAVESVRLAEEVEVDVLLHARTQDVSRRDSLESGLLRRLRALGAYTTAAEERRVYDDATRLVDAYLTTGAPDAHDAAIATLETLVGINVEQARAAQANAARWDQVANVAGLTVAVLVVVSGLAIVVWLRRRAFAPMFALAETMERFGRGELDARARETGGSELRDISRRFNEMAGALEDMQRRKGAFLGGVAHDLRTPLSVIRLSLSLAPSDRPLPPEPRIRQVWDRIDRQVTRLERMVNDFLDLSRLEGAELDLQLERCDLGEVVRGVVAMFEDAESQRIQLRVADGAVIAVCDRIRTEQIVANLVSNALKYSPPATPIEVAVEPSGGEISVKVTDRGVGIDVADRERVFEPFRRVGMSKESVPGVGLGLFVVRRLVAAQGGRIVIGGAPGLGSSFEVFLPRDGAGAERRVG